MAYNESFLFQRDTFVAFRRPSFDGCNVGTWIGFKHIVCLGQEAVLDYLHDRQCAPGVLFQSHGVVTEFTDCRLRLLKAIRVDDVVAISVTSSTQSTDTQATLDVVFRRPHSEGGERLAQGRVNVAWRSLNLDLGDADPPPPAIVPFVTSSTETRPARPSELFPVAATQMDALQSLRPVDKASAARCVRVAYPMCQSSGQMALSAHVRILEEMVDIFLAERGISIATLLAERRWIPVVSKVSLAIERPAYMEEFLYAVFFVNEVVKDIVFTGRLESYVIRNGRLARAAVGAIDHAYVQFDTREVGSDLATFDARVRTALQGDESRT